MAHVTITSALRLSALSLLSFVGYALMEMRYFLGSWIPGDLAAMLEAFFVMMVVGGWLWALAAASGGKKSGLTALLGLSGLVLLIALYDLQYLFPGPLPWPQATMILVMLGTALVAIVAIALVRPRKHKAVE